MKRDLFSLALVVAAIVFFCQTILWTGASPFRGDIPLQFYPWKCYTQQMLSEGEIPYWNPYTYGGAPFLANMQSAVFYPFDLILFFFPMEWFFGLSLLIHLLLAGIGAFFLARICGASSFPALIAGIAYGLNGFTMIHIPAGNHLTYAGAAWVPWLLWVTVGFVTTKQSRLPWALGGSLIVFLHFLCGHPQMMFYSLVFSFLSCLILGLWIEKSKEKPNFVVPIIRTSAWSLFLLLGIALAGMQLLPTIQYFFEANRASSLDLQMATEFSFAPHRLITLFCPEFYGTMLRGTHYDHFVYWSCAYAGCIVPGLALIASIRCCKSYPVVIPLAITAFLGLLFAWGRGNPVYSLLFHLPGFGHFRAPAKYLPYYLAPLCVLASLGVEYLGDRIFTRFQNTTLNGHQKKFRFVTILGIWIVLFITFVYYGNPWLTGLSSEKTFQFTQTITGIDMQNPTSSSNLTAKDWVIAFERTASYLRLGLLLLFTLLSYWMIRWIPQSPRMVLSFVLGLILFLDLYEYGKNYLDASLVTVDAIHASTQSPPEINAIRPLRSDPRPDRVMNLSDLDIPNVLMHWHAYNIAGYDPMSLRGYNQQIGLLENWKPGDYHDNIQLTQIDHPVLDRLNVRFILTHQELSQPQVALRETGSRFRVYERVQTSRSWAMTQPDAAERSEIWNPVDSQIDFKEYRPHSIRFTYATDQSIRMRVSEWAYPGWQAEAILQNDQHERIAIQSSPEGFRILTIPAKTKEIHLSYQAPWSGWALTGVSGILFLSLVSLAYVSRLNGFLYVMQRIMGRNF